MSQPFLGQTAMFAGNFAPLGWAFCNGQTIAISQNSALFNLIGTTYGGDGQSTFNLPDLRSRVPIHQGSNGVTNYIVGQNGGVETVNLSVNQIPSHNHLLLANGSTDSNTPTTNVILANEGGADASKVSIYAPFDTTSANMTTLLPTSLSSAGSSQPHDNLQPYLAINYIIALEGIYPSQS